MGEEGAEAKGHVGSLLVVAEDTRAPGLRGRTTSQQQRSGQLDLFDDPTHCS